MGISFFREARAAQAKGPTQAKAGLCGPGPLPGTAGSTSAQPSLSGLEEEGTCELTLPLQQLSWPRGIQAQQREVQKRAYHVAFNYY